MFHCVMAIEKFNSMPRWVRWIGRPFGFWGHQSVDVFIVLSGFCLMLPVAKSGELKLRNGFVSYLTKRAWRILPPYYAVLLICLVMTALLPALRQPGPSWRHALPAFEPGMIISHLLLIHNWSLDWFQKINPSLWSIAVEWQIYFVFPLLLWIFKRAGWLTGVFAGFAIGFSVFLFTTQRVAGDVLLVCGLVCARDGSRSCSHCNVGDHQFRSESTVAGTCRHRSHQRPHLDREGGSGLAD